MKCRHCGSTVKESFADLGFAPASNAYLSNAELHQAEQYFPLQILVCEKCWLVQTEDYNTADTFFSDDYAYFSSTSLSWLEHAKAYCTMIANKLSLDEKSLVIEVASNDGYLLKNFIDKNIPCLGIEPTKGTAEAARKLGINVIEQFFGTELSKELAEKNQFADLIIGNNVYAHVPDINDFTRGMKEILAPNGVITLEFPHLLELITHCQFDTIYHEHFSYLSLNTVSKIFNSYSLCIYDVEKLDTHGGSLRIYAMHEKNAPKISTRVEDVLLLEQKFGLLDIATYLNFQSKITKIKNELLTFLIEKFNSGKKVIAYGAAAKGNTLLNYAGIKPDLISAVFDAAKAKQNKYMPGSHIPIFSPDKISFYKPDCVLILPWNIAPEVKNILSNQLTPDVEFYIAVPEIKKI